jgi:hypothetical protein
MKPPANGGPRLTFRRTARRNTARWTASIAVSLGAVACSSDDDASPTDTGEVTVAQDTAAPATEGEGTAEPPTTDSAPTSEAEDTVASTEPEAAGSGATDTSAAFPDLEPPTGEEFVIGLVNTEGTPGLDFPDIRIYTQAAADYLNQHGGMGGRPIRLEHCAAAGSPETSQADHA